VGKEIKVDNNFLTALEYYYEKQETETRECLLALKAIILSIDENIVHTRKYQIPFFCYKEFKLGFLWVYRKRILVGFVEDKKTFSQPTKGRERDSVTTIEINPSEDIPIEKIQQIAKQLIKKYSEACVSMHPENN
jgi:hypothetical protein